VLVIAPLIIIAEIFHPIMKRNHVSIAAGDHLLITGQDWIEIEMNDLTPKN